MKKLKFPTPYTVLMLVIVLAASLTFLLPSGSYSTLQYDKQQDSFVIHTANNSYTVPATQEQLDGLGIHIQLSKFKDEKIKNLFRYLILMCRAYLTRKELNLYFLHLYEESTTV